MCIHKLENEEKKLSRFVMESVDKNYAFRPCLNSVFMRLKISWKIRKAIKVLLFFPFLFLSVYFFLHIFFEVSH